MKRKVFDSLNEKQQRLYLGEVAVEYGKGGITKVAAEYGACRERVSKGMREYKAGESYRQGEAVRRAGGGRKKKTDITGSNFLGDKAYGTKEIIAYIKEHGATVVIPPKSNAKEPWEIDYCLYKERHLIECFFQKIKWFRRVATRYDKLDKSFLAFVYMAAVMIWLL